MASKSKGRKGKKLKRKWQVKQPNWLELPSDLMMNILQRVGVVDVLENAQNVCTEWREFCKDPAMWRIVYLEQFSDPISFQDMMSDPKVSRKLCLQVVDISQGQMVDVTVVGISDSDLLHYVVDRSSQLRRLELVLYLCTHERLSEAFEKLSLLEELSLVRSVISEENIEAAGCYCPLNKNTQSEPKSKWLGGFSDADDELVTYLNRIALAIGKNLPELTHLELIGSGMTNTGLQAILDGCRHLESLDLRRCFYLDLTGDLGRRCSQQIKYLKLPHDSLQGYLRTYNITDDLGSDEFYDYLGV